MTEHHIEIKKNARYYLLGNLNEHTKRVFFVLHGYGMNAKDFLASFEPLLQQEIAIIAPEALNRYYLKMAGGVVDATWMTREDRLVEIKDYIQYLEDLCAAIREQAPNAAITALGFSQGASTVTRWVDKSKHPIHQLIVYAGEVAPELVPLTAESGLWNTKNIFICGTHDEYFTPPVVQKMKESYTDLKFTDIEFNGKHVIVAEILLPFFKG